MKDLPKWLKLIKGDLGNDDSGPIEMLLDGPIGFDRETYTGHSSAEFGRVLASIKKDRQVHLLINSLGGMVHEGLAMANMISARGNVHTCAIGYAASAGAIVHQAGAVRKMMPGSMLMIHPVQGGAEGDEDDIEEYLNILRTTNQGVIDMLANRTGNSKKKVKDWMDATTAMGPEEAKKNGFCDEIVDPSPMWNDLSKSYSPAEMLVALKNNFRGQKVPRNGGTVPEQTENKTESNIMKLLIAALASAGLLPSADMTDETAITNSFRTKFDTFKNEGSTKETELTTLKNRVKTFEDAQKIRVTNRVQKAIDDKLVKEARKESLINTGLRDESELDAILNDLQEVKGTAAPAVKPPVNRGTAPVPPGTAEGETTDDKIIKLQESLKNASPSQKIQISRQIRTLRGNDKIFTANQPVAAKN